KGTRAVETLRTGGQVTDLTDRRVAVVRDGGARIYTAGRADPSILARPGEALRTVALEPQGRRAVSVDVQGQSLLWDPLTMGWDLRPLARRTVAAAFTPDGRTLATFAEEGPSRLWTLADRLGRPFHTAGTPLEAAFRNGTMALATSEGGWVG